MGKRVTFPEGMDSRSDPGKPLRKVMKEEKSTAWGNCQMNMPSRWKESRLCKLLQPKPDKVLLA